LLQQASEKLFSTPEIVTDSEVSNGSAQPGRMLKKAVQQGRSKRRGEEVHTTLRVNRSPRRMDLGERRNPFRVEPLRVRSIAPRSAMGSPTPLADFFSILLKVMASRLA
jgi:hypothetical protein